MRNNWKKEEDIITIVKTLQSFWGFFGKRAWEVQCWRNCNFAHCITITLDGTCYSFDIGIEM